MQSKKLVVKPTFEKPTTTVQTYDECPTFYLLGTRPSKQIFIDEDKFVQLLAEQISEDIAVINDVNIHNKKTSIHLYNERGLVMINAW